MSTRVRRSFFLRVSCGFYRAHSRHHRETSYRAIGRARTFGFQSVRARQTSKIFVFQKYPVFDLYPSLRKYARICTPSTTVRGSKRNIQAMMELPA